MVQGAKKIPGGAAAPSCPHTSRAYGYDRTQIIQHYDSNEEVVA